MSRISDLRRREILQAATEVFGTNGISGVSMSEIAERAGIGKSTIYEYFPSKDDLFSEACREKMLEIAKSVQVVFAREQPFRIQFCAYCEVLLDTMKNLDINTALMQLINNSLVEELTKSARQMRDFSIQQIMQALRRAQETGEINPELDPRLTACYLAILPNPHLIRNLQDQGVENPIDQLLELAFNGLTGR